MRQGRDISVDRGAGSGVDHATGATVFSVARDRIGYRLGEKEWHPFVERDTRGMGLWVAQNPTWIDGSPLTTAEIDEALEVIKAVYRRMHVKLQVLGWPAEQPTPDTGLTGSGPSARFSPTGEVAFFLGGRTWHPDAARDGSVVHFTVESTPRWDDGTVMTPAEVGEAMTMFRSAASALNLDLRLADGSSRRRDS